MGGNQRVPIIFNINLPKGLVSAGRNSLSTNKNVSMSVTFVKSLFFLKKKKGLKDIMKNLASSAELF